MPRGSIQTPIQGHCQVDACTHSRSLKSANPSRSRNRLTTASTASRPPWKPGCIDRKTPGGDGAAADGAGGVGASPSRPKTSPYGSGADRLERTPLRQWGGYPLGTRPSPESRWRSNESPSSGESARGRSAWTRKQGEEEGGRKR